MPRLSRQWIERKTTDNENGDEIHRDIHENDKETNHDTLNRLIE